jgi:teichuronic acid biosynthesis glycosyltransferase TuaG
MSDLAPVSVIIPCFKSGDTVRRAVSSVLRQTIAPAQILLIDDASPDGSAAVLRELQASNPDRVQVLELAVNVGAAGARNAGWDLATQPFVAFLDADDVWRRDKLEVQLALFDREPGAFICGHGIGTLLAHQEPPEVPDAPIAPPRRIGAREILLGNPFATSSVVMRRDTPLRFDATKRRSEDYHLWARLALSGATAVILHEPLGYRFKAAFGESGLSGDLWQMEKAELDTYRRLCSDGLLSPGLFLPLCAWSVTKYLRRLIVAAARRGSGGAG